MYDLCHFNIYSCIQSFPYALEIEDLEKVIDEELIQNFNEEQYFNNVHR